MARSHARLLVKTWADPDFRALTGAAQRMYFVLISQANLTQAGTLPLTLSRWVTYAVDSTSEGLVEGLRELELHRYVYVDYDLQEVLIRTFIKNDGVYKQPNVMAAAVRDAETLISQRLRSVLREELFLLPEAEMEKLHTSRGRSVLEMVSDLIDTLKDPDPAPPGNPSPKGTDKGTAMDTWRRGVVTELEVSPSPTPTPSSIPQSTSEIETPGEDADHTPGVVEVREDVERLCTHLADRIETNGATTRPHIGKRWRDAARLLMDNDHVTEQQIHAAIDWCQDHEFWRGNILSMPKLRDKYNQLRLQAQRERGQSSTTSATSKANAWLTVGRDQQQLKAIGGGR